MRRVLPWASAAAMVLVVGAASVASAAFGSSATAGATYTSAALSPPTSPSTSHGPCQALSSASIRINWTASPSTWATGYEVQRSTTSGGPYSTIATVSGVGTVTYLNGSLPFSTTYHYVVRATKGNWRSASTTQVSRTTLSFLCL
ncbi:MAG: hypothetical protein WD691_04050 [Acidimicrobiales bacterium]